jgi:predicted enzyme related to lactoylglutathione lyase
MTQIFPPSVNAIHGFEIPVRAIDRAQAFYTALLGVPLRRETMGANTLAVFAYRDTGVSGCLMAGAAVPEPSTSGTLVFLDAGPWLDAALARVPAAGGRVTTPKVPLTEGMGCFAHIADTEGNRVGLHAMA